MGSFVLPGGSFSAQKCLEFDVRKLTQCNRLVITVNFVLRRVLSKILKFTGTICGIKCTFRGQENVSTEKTCILVANHQSALDLIGNKPLLMTDGSERK